MRLIDADALLYTHKIEQEAIGKDWGVDDLAAAIKTAPTIDAIPIEWLEQKYKENEPSEDKDDYDYFLWDAIAYILMIWRKEQNDTKTN